MFINVNDEWIYKQKNITTCNSASKNENDFKWSDHYKILLCWCQNRLKWYRGTMWAEHFDSASGSWFQGNTMLGLPAGAVVSSVAWRICRWGSSQNTVWHLISPIMPTVSKYLISASLSCSLPILSLSLSHFISQLLICLHWSALWL